MTKKEIISELEELLSKNIEFEDTFVKSFNNAAFRKKLKNGQTVKDYIRTERKSLKRLLEHIKTAGKTEKRASGASIARNALQKKTKDKVQNAINGLIFENKPITPYQVSKYAQISYNTAKKYLNEMKTSPERQ